MFKRCLSGILLFLALMGCEKSVTEPAIKIWDTINYYEQVNDYFDLENFKHATWFYFSCSISAPESDPIQRIVIDMHFSDGTERVLVIKESFLHFNDDFSFRLPIRFNESNKVTLNYRIVSENNIQSNMESVIINKPLTAF